MRQQRRFATRTDQQNPAGPHAIAVIFLIIAPIFGTVLIGWLAARLGAFDEASVRGLSLFAFNFALPVMLARQLSRVDLPDRPDWALVLVYFGSAVLVFAAGAALARGAWRHGGGAEPAIFGISAAFSNVLVLGVPLILKAHGEAATLPLSLLVACHSAFMFSLTTVVAEAGLGSTGTLRELPLGILRGLVTNPILWGIGIGMALNIAGLTLPAVLDQTAATLGAAALPCAMFALGANLSRFRLGERLRPALLLTALKNLVHPALVYVLGRYVVELSPVAFGVALTTACMPTGINAYLFAARYGAAVAEASSTILLSTLVSIATLSAALVLLRG